MVSLKTSEIQIIKSSLCFTSDGDVPNNKLVEKLKACFTETAESQEIYCLTQFSGAD